MFYKKKFFILNAILFLISASAFSQEYKINYYGVFSSDIDENMKKMTSDLYFTQLSALNDLTVTDLRDSITNQEAFSQNQLSLENYSFYTEIKKIEDSDKWISIIHLKSASEDYSKSKEYDSFYKILMEPKNTLQESLNQLLNDKIKQTPLESAESGENITSTQNIAGTWKAENFINKVILLKSGRGFVIFNNGASMNVSIEIDENNKVIITQNGHSNASFYPQLPREVALNAALEAKPLKWTLNLTDSNTLKGTKETLNSNGNGYSYVTENVEWKKQL